jgi:hypothetical protein
MSKDQYLKFRRSSVPGKIPTTSSIGFGEIALNTYDGLAFIKKSGSNGEEVVTLGGGTGEGNISGSQNFVPVFNTTSSLATSSIYDSGSFTAIGSSTPSDPTNPERLLIDAGTTTSYNLISAKGEVNNYLQLNIQNLSSGDTGSSDIVATANNGDETSYYIDMGINGSGYGSPSGIGGSNDAYLYSRGQDLLIGNASPNQRVILFNGEGPALDNARIYITANGVVAINTTDYDILNPPALQVQAINNTTYNLIQAEGDVDNYLQIGIANKSTGSNASTDLALYNNIDPEGQLSGFIDIGINSTNYVSNSFYPGKEGDAYVFTDSSHLLLGSTTGSSDSKVTLFAGGVNEAENAKLILYGNNSHELTGSLRVHSGSITSSLFGTASWANNATTASYVLGSNIDGLNLSRISTGSVTASVNLGSTSFSLVNGSTSLLSIGSDGITTIPSIVRFSKDDFLGISQYISQQRGFDINVSASSGDRGVRIYATHNLTSIPNGAAIQFFSSDHSAFPGQFYLDSGAATNSALIFRTAGSGQTITERMRVTSNGNVLIGTSINSSFMLDVAGPARFSGVGSITVNTTVLGTLATFSAPGRTLTINLSSTGGTFSNFAHVQPFGIVTDGFGSAFHIGTNNSSASSVFSVYTNAGSQIQTDVVIGPQNRNASSMLTLNSTVRGFLPPRMILAQRVAIASPAVGLIVYDSGSATEGLWINESTGWHQFLTNTGSQSISGSLAATSFTGSLEGTSSWAVSASWAPVSTTASFALSASQAQTASFAPGYLPLTGGTIDGNVTVNGTASIAFLNVTIESASVIYSSGSNQFGDATNDTQTLVGTVIVSGSQQVTGSLFVTDGITGSLFGTSSWANNATSASYILNAVSSSFSTSASFAPNLYNTNGTLTGNRILNLSGSSLDISGSTTTRFFANGRVGIGTTIDGGFQLDVSGVTRIGNSGNQITSNAVDVTIDGFAAGSSRILLRSRNSSNVFTDKITVPNGNDLAAIFSGSVDIRGNTVITGSFTVVTGSAREFQVRNTGVDIGSVLSDTHTVTGSFNISGSLNAPSITGSLFGTSSWANNVTSASFASTASYASTFIISSSLYSAQSATGSASTTTTLVSVPTGSYTAGFFDYTVSSGSSARAGTVMSVWNGASVQFTDNSTLDIGNTNDVTMSVALSGGNMLLRSTTTAFQWSVKTTYRLI